MLVEFFAFLGAVGIAVTIFIIIVALADRPVKALITALMFAYVLFYVYIFLLKRKGGGDTTGPQEEKRLE